MSNLPTAEFDPRRVTDEGLKEMRKVAIDRIAPVAPRLGEWLHRWCDNEGIRRREMPDKSRLAHAVAVPNDLPSWSNADVGLGMAAVTQLSYCVFDEALGMMVDRLCLVFSGECRRRLTQPEAAQ